MAGEVDRFAEKGLYDGLFLMSDSRTGTYWNHMTGEAVYGPLAGERLELENVLHTTVEQALAADPETMVAISTHPPSLQSLVIRDGAVERTGTITQTEIGATLEQVLEIVNHP